MFPKASIQLCFVFTMAYTLNSLTGAALIGNIFRPDSYICSGFMLYYALKRRCLSLLEVISFVVMDTFITFGVQLFLSS